MKKRKTTEKRPYQMGIREMKQAQTRAKIVQATMELHGEMGPRGTTIKGIAERAGVERLTVYRHFPDEASVFSACSHRFRELNPPPELVDAKEARGGYAVTKEGLEALYDYYRQTAYMLEKIYRDVKDYESLRSIMEAFDGYLRSYGEAMRLHWQSDRDELKWVLYHSVRFSTWQSLESEQLSNGRKAELMTRWAKCVAE